MKQLIVASTSTLHGESYLEYLLPELKELFKNTEDLVFIPYARPGGISHDEYTKIAQKAFRKIDITVRGIHTFKDPKKAISNAKGLFTGGGNTFVLVNQLYQLDLMAHLKHTIETGTPYLGTSAGSNICGLNMKTTNDMPIVYPPSFRTLGILPFNINPHYLDPDPNSNHMGETREKRIQEFHSQNDISVLGLREGSWIRVFEDDIILEGPHTARVFKPNQAAYEVPSATNFKKGY